MSYSIGTPRYLPQTHMGSHSSSHKCLFCHFLRVKGLRGAHVGVSRLNQAIPSCHPDYEDGDTIRTYESQQVFISDPHCNSEQWPNETGRHPDWETEGVRLRGLLSSWS